jgi:hypothetical protein
MLFFDITWLFFFFDISSSQELSKVYSVDSSVNGWSCWDVRKDYLINCLNVDGYQNFNVWNTTTNELIRTFKRTSLEFVVIDEDSYYIGEYFSKNLTKYDLVSGTFLEKVRLPYSTSGYDPLTIYNHHFYIRTHHPFGLAIASIENGTLITWIPDQKDRWLVQADGIYSYLTVLQTTYLAKKDPLGKTLWNVSLPFSCKLDDSEIGYIASHAPFVYSICEKGHSLTQILSSNGNLVRYFGVSNSEAFRSVSSSSSIFILFKDMSILEYTSETADFVAKYKRDGDQGIQFPSLKFSNGFIFCLVKTANGLNILQWKAKTIPTKTKFVYNFAETRNLRYLHFMDSIQYVPNNATLNTVTFINRFSNIQKVVWQTSYIDSVVRFNGKSWLMNYFGGASNLQRGTFSPNLLYELQISTLAPDDKTPYIYSSRPIKSFTEAYFLHCYASILIEPNLYFIHGGMSNTLATVYSNGFIIDLDLDLYSSVLSSSVP